MEECDFQITIMNAARRRFGTDDFRGRVFLSSGRFDKFALIEEIEDTLICWPQGMGGMSGAQPKACQLLGLIGVVAEMSEEAAKKRHEQGWCQELIYDLEKLISRIRECREKKIVTSIGFIGNIVTLWWIFVQSSTNYWPFFSID